VLTKHIILLGIIPFGELKEKNREAEEEKEKQGHRERKRGRFAQDL